MESAVTIGLDLGKSVFQVHGVSAGGAVVVQRAPAARFRSMATKAELRRGPTWRGRPATADDQ